MKSHHIKIHQRYFYDVCVGKKPFEFRKNDRDYREGDCVFLEEVAKNEDGELEYTGRVCIVIIKHVYHLGEVYPELEEYVVFTFAVLHKKGVGT